jgi:putative transcriptional regulator
VRTGIRTTKQSAWRSGAQQSLAGAGLLLALSLSVGATHPAPPESPPARESERPAVGRFLVATESIRGSIFHESVVYLVNYSEGGALGLIVNRPTEFELHDVVEGAVEGSGMLFLGGPVESSSVMMLLRSDDPPERALRVADDIFVSVDPEVLLEHAASIDSGRLRAYAGYAGWGPRQLDAEIARGQWLVVSAPSRAIFEEEPAGLWKKWFRQYHRLITKAPSALRIRS